MEKKVLFLDMDGTTLNDQVEIPKENLEAIQQAVAAGHEVVITTGRPMASAHMLLEKWGLDKVGCRYVIAFNGGMVLDAISETVIYEKSIPVDWMKTIVREARKRDIYVHTYEGKDVLADRDCEALQGYIKKNRMQAKLVSDLEKDIKEAADKMLAIDLEDYEKLKQFCEDMKEWADGKVDMYFSTRQYLEIMPAGVSKGAAVEAFCEKMGIPIENSISAGDEQNDISMIRSAGVGCAVANAIPEAKAVADYVTEHDNNQGAIAEIIKKFMMVDR